MYPVPENNELYSTLTKFVAIKALDRFKNRGSDRPYFTSAQRRQFVQYFHDATIAKATWSFKNDRTFFNWLSCEHTIVEELTASIFKKLGLDFDSSHLPVNYTVGIVISDETTCEWGETANKRSIGPQFIPIVEIKTLVAEFFKPAPPCENHLTYVGTWIAYKVSCQFDDKETQTSGNKRKESPSFFTDQERDSFILKFFDAIEKDLQSCLESKQKFSLSHDQIDARIIDVFSKMKREMAKMAPKYSIEVVPHDYFTVIETVKDQKISEEYLNCVDIQKRIIDLPAKP